MISAARILIAAVALASLGAAPSHAQDSQDSRYSSDWRNPAATAGQPANNRVQEMVDELNRMIDSAATAKAADPVFLRDLRDLVRRYDWPWRNRVLFDDFSDGNVTANPAWTVEGAPVAAEQLDGLRTRVTLAPPQAGSSTGGGSDQPADVAVQILGQILQQRSGGSSETSSSAPARQSETVLVANAATANAFAVLADVVFVEAQGGTLELGVAQSADKLGYRAAIRPKASGATVEILRVGARGTGVVDSAEVAQEVWQARAATDPRTILFSRDAAGEMQVSVNGTKVLTTSDRAFRDRFDGVILRNGGGEYLVKSIAGYSQ